MHYFYNQSDKEQVSDYESPKPRRRRRRRDESRDERDGEARYSRRRGPVIGQAPNPDFDRVRPKIDNHGQVSQRHHR